MNTLPHLTYCFLGAVTCPHCGDQTAPGATAEDQNRKCPKCNGGFFYWGQWGRITSLEPFDVDICYVSEKRPLSTLPPHETT
jgi:hypothetical protein